MWSASAISLPRVGVESMYPHDGAGVPRKTRSRQSKRFTALPRWRFSGNDILLRGCPIRVGCRSGKGVLSPPQTILQKPRSFTIGFSRVRVYDLRDDLTPQRVEGRGRPAAHFGGPWRACLCCSSRLFVSSGPELRGHAPGPPSAGLGLSGACAYAAAGSVRPAAPGIHRCPLPRCHSGSGPS
jgi:hypothetical protein